MFHRPQRNFRRRRASSSSSSSSSSNNAEEKKEEEEEEKKVDKEEEEEEEGSGSGQEGPEGPGAEHEEPGPGPNSPPAVGPDDPQAIHLSKSWMLDNSGDEGDESRPSSDSEVDHYSSSESQSSASQEKDSSPVKIPDAAYIQAARRKRQLARSQCSFIPLNTNPKTGDKPFDLKSGDADSEDEPDDHEKRIQFAPKPQTLKQRMTEETSSPNDDSRESQEDETQDIWERQQMSKAVKITQGIDLSHTHRPQPPKIKIDTARPPVNLEIIKKKLNLRLTSLQDIHRSHQREYEKYLQDIETSKSTIKRLEKASEPALNYKFYKGMKTYLENLVDCLNEKMVDIKELESSMYLLLRKQAKILLKRRQEDLLSESTYLQKLSGKTGTPTDDSVAVDEKVQLLEECKARRAHRRQARESTGKCDHQEGMSSDDEVSPAEMNDFQKTKDDILQSRKKIFEDVHEDFCIIENILVKFQQWREKFPDSYYEAYVSLCLPKLLNPLIIIELIDWNPLKPDCIGLKQMSWFRSVEEFIKKDVSELKKEGNPDEKILPTIIDKTVIPQIAGFVEFVWDPLSTSQTSSLIKHYEIIFGAPSTCDSEARKAKQDLMGSIISRMKKAIDEDVFIPLYPTCVVEDKTSPHLKFQERQFWSALKLFGNILLWDGFLLEDALWELGLSRLLNRYLITCLPNVPPGPDLIEKCHRVIACLPERWFRGLHTRSSLPQLAHFTQFLVQLAHKLYKSEKRDQLRDLICLLVKVRALDQAEAFIEEYSLEQLKLIIEEAE
ncbi:intron Large complex component GCFC2 [Tachyglossus aculeatus]|uniref:intron Large complex component GCFC2 n=1 Tax=Tachyglossus aculeatus TaxID=9261 RepID=UPI0018F41C39|nr:intron Large complex component GCFC2 [Tachyglossus aculeatus]